MATRNRTEDFIKLRNVQRPARTEKDTEGLLPDDGERAGGAARVKIVPAWVRHLEDIRTMEKHIKIEVEQLTLLHKDHLKVQFGASRDEDKEERDINEKTSHIGKLFKTCEQAISDLDLIYRDELDEDDGGSDADLTILRNVKMCLINEINGLSRDFREKQREYLTAIQKQKGVRQRWGGGQEKELADRDKRDTLLAKGCTQEQIETIMLNEEMIEDRNKEFQTIYESIKSLHEMFTDLHGMVIEQGTVLDRIDYNMNLTVERVKKGRKELEKASKHQEAGRFKLLLMFLIVLIIGFMLALLLKLFRIA